LRSKTLSKTAMRSRSAFVEGEEREKKGIGKKNRRGETHGGGGVGGVRLRRLTNPKRPGEKSPEKKKKMQRKQKRAGKGEIGRPKDGCQEGRGGPLQRKKAYKKNDFDGLFFSKEFTRSTVKSKKGQKPSSQKKEERQRREAEQKRSAARKQEP